MAARHALAIAFGAAIAAGAAAQAYEIRFAGQSKASPQLKRDVLTAITGYAKARYQCSFAFSIDAVPMPAAFTPQNPMYRIDSAQRIYERWEVNLCGTKRPFLVGLWPTPDGGANYKVGEIKQGNEP